MYAIYVLSTMIIPITIPSTSNPKLPPSLAKIGHDEIVLIELQGSLQVECSHDSERNGKFVGKLSINESGVRDCSLHQKNVAITLLYIIGYFTKNRPTLTIGHHLLEGKVATLPKPLAVLQRSGSSRSKQGVRIHDLDIEGDDDA